MTQPQITLSISDEQGRAERAAVSAPRFTIGTSSDNDLVVDMAGVSRRHALIENCEGAVQLSDCGSETGTLVNGMRISGGVALKDGDTISIGSACRIRVNISRARPERADASIAKPLGPTAASNRPAQRAAQRFSTPVIAVLAVLAILLVAVPLVAWLNKDVKRAGRAAPSADPRSGDENKPAPRQSRDERDAKQAGEPVANSIAIEQVETVAVQFMRRISSDDRPYVFPPYAVKGLDDIKRRVEQVSASAALAEALTSIATAGPSIAAEARREGIEPGLVIITALVEMESGRLTGGQTAITRRLLPEMMSLKKTLGTESADKSLILVAAYRMGGGTKKSHPLLQTMRRVVKNPLTDRNVWYLREHGGLDDQTYNFVVSFLALGVIAESPRRFGVTAAPVAY